MAEGKIKSKDLSYESTLPPFLQRLHAQKAGLADQDRHERPVARPRRTKAGDEDDGPTVVDESGDLVSTAEFEKLTKEPSAQEDSNVKGALEGSGEPEGSGAIQEGEGEERKGGPKVTDGAAIGKKRKVAKVVGDEAENEPVGADDGPNAKVVKKVKKKKGKPIKLAFDQDEGDEGT